MFFSVFSEDLAITNLWNGATISMIISASLTFTEAMFPAARIQGARIHEVDARYATTFDLIQVQGETVVSHCVHGEKLFRECL